MYELDTKKLHRDVLKKLNRLNKPQEHLAKRMGFSRCVIWNLGTKNSINFRNFFKLVYWLEKEPQHYIVKLTKKDYENKS